MLASQLPDPGDPSFPALFGVFGAFVGTAVALLLGYAWDDARDFGLKAGFVWTGIGVAIYLFELIPGIY